MKFFLNTIYLLFFLNTISQAQTASLYKAGTGILVKTYTTIQAAVDAALPYDSIVLSPDIFYEHDINSLFHGPFIIQGSIKGRDTTTIDAQGHNSCFFQIFGTIRDINLVNTDTFLGAVTSPLLACKFLLSKNITIKNCTVNYPLTYFDQSERIFEQCDLKIFNNIFLKTKGGGYLDSIYSPFYFNNVYPFDVNMQIFNNKFEDSVYYICIMKMYGSKDTMNIKNLSISNNNGGAAIILLPSYKSTSFPDNENFIINFQDINIINNVFLINCFAFTVIAHSSSTDTFRYKVNIKNSHIYNKNIESPKRVEVYIKNYGISPIPSNMTFQSSGCWWGSSDTSGIFKLDSGVKFKLDDWAIAHWFAVPYGKDTPLTMTNVRADIIRNDSSRYPDNSLKSMEGQFYALGGGYFSPTRVPINPSNVIASDYHFPTGSGAYSVMAVIDADTFRPTKAMLGIQEVGFEQVRVYPIPAQDYLQIEGAALGTQFLLYDISGKLVLNERSNANPAQLNINTLSSGSYLLKLISPEGKIGTAKVQKE